MSNIDTTGAIEPDHGLARFGLDFSNQHVVVVGAGGIGAEAIRLLAALGARLTVFDLSSNKRLQESLPNRALHEWHAADIAGPEGRRSIIDKASGADALIITSAICPDESQLSGLDDWNVSFDQVMQVNLAGPMYVCEQVVAAMMQRGAGRVVLTGSLAGRMGGLLAGSQYSASKGALHTFVKWLALRSAPHGVNVNGVAPGVTQTPMIEDRAYDASRIPAGRAGQPIEIARAIVFLSSPAASYIHGQVLDVNGGAWLG